MSTLTPPRANIPIGWVVINGVKVPAAIESEWLRYLAGSLFDRGGGTVGSGTGDLETAQYDDAGIDDLKARVAQLADESSAAVFAEFEPLRARVEALELLPAGESVVQNITNNTTTGNDVFAATFFGAL